MNKSFACLIIAAGILLRRDAVEAQTTKPDSAGSTHVRKVEKAPNFVRSKPDPFVGDWQGAAGLVAQVFLSPAGDYQANLLKAFDTESNLIATLSGVCSDGAISFAGEGWTGAITQSHFTVGNGKDHFDLQHVTRHSPTLGLLPPKGAIVLFDGHGLDAWAKKAGKDWLIENGPGKWKPAEGDAIEIVPGTDCLITHQKFGHCHLHVEFRTLGVPSKSAVFLESRYEVNINETYGRSKGAMAGGLDNTTAGGAPPIRAALPPLAWQTLDIDFRAPSFDSAGHKKENPRMTVLLNGVKLYEDQELDPPHGSAGRLGEAPTGPLMLQDHLTPLQYRNIWIQETTHDAPRAQ